MEVVHIIIRIPTSCISFIFQEPLCPSTKASAMSVYCALPGCVYTMEVLRPASAKALKKESPVQSIVTASRPQAAMK